jgi:hypothetical protein
VPTSQHLGYLIHTCVMDTDEEAFEMAAIFAAAPLSSDAAVVWQPRR